jgi:hypothetical protein
VHPALRILLLLSVTIGVPFVALSATTPLVQRWLTGRPGSAPYWLFAVSNFASLAALLAFPAVFERLWDTSIQRVAWSVAYGVFAILFAVVAWRARQFSFKPGPSPERSAVGGRTLLLWLALPAVSSMLLVAITNHISQNVAAVPLLWIVPLGLYLLSFIVAFGKQSWYRRGTWLRWLALALGLIAYAIQDIRAVEAIQISVPVFLFGLFAGCLFCHGELSALKPASDQSTLFYLVVAAGGAAGSIFTALIAPQIFQGVYELPFTLILLGALVLIVTWGQRSIPLRLLWAGVSAGMLIIFIRNVQAYHHDALVLERSFYGSLRVLQTPLVTEQQERSLFHGTIRHGAEFLWPTVRNRPTTYYGPDSGIGIVLRECYPSPKSVGVVGLGVGTLAAYGNAGDDFRFYEINPQVVNIAEGLFYFLRQSPAEKRIEIGDGRLLLERDRGSRFDVLILDAFSGDAIPVHLLTREAFQLYRERLKPGGTIAFHVSNQYLDLAGIVQQLAQQQGFQSVLVRSHEDIMALVDAADWMLVTSNPGVLENESVRRRAQAIIPRKNKRPWTDSYSNLLEAFRPLSIKQN